MLNIYEIYSISSLVISLRVLAIVCHKRIAIWQIREALKQRTAFIAVFIACFPPRSDNLTPASVDRSKADSSPSEFTPADYTPTASTCCSRSDSRLSASFVFLRLFGGVKCILRELYLADILDFSKGEWINDIYLALSAIFKCEIKNTKYKEQKTKSWNVQNTNKHTECDTEMHNAKQSNYCID